MPSPFDFLSILGGGMPQAAPVPEAAFDPSSLNTALAQNALQPRPQQEGGGFLAPGSKSANILGMIGDALSIIGGGQPTYAPYALQERKRKKMSVALQNYLGQSNAAIGEMVGAGIDLGDALSIYKMTHPEAEKPPAFIQEYLYRQGLDPEQRKSFDEFANLRKFNPFGAPITLGPGDTIETPGGPAAAPATNLPTVTDKASYDAIPNGAQFRDPEGNIRTKGGQSGGGSTGGFL